jgi:hypothetical protein
MAGKVKPGSKKWVNFIHWSLSTHGLWFVRHGLSAIGFWVGKTKFTAMARSRANFYYWKHEPLFPCSSNSKEAQRWGIGIIVSIAGSVLSYGRDWPMGATIVCIFGLTVAFISSIVRMKNVD